MIHKELQALVPVLGNQPGFRGFDFGFRAGFCGTAGLDSKTLQNSSFKSYQDLLNRKGYVPIMLRSNAVIVGI